MPGILNRFGVAYSSSDHTSRIAGLVLCELPRERSDSPGAISLTLSIAPDSGQSDRLVELFVFIDSSGTCPEPSRVRFTGIERPHD